MKRPVAAVAGTGRGLPQHVMTNHDFASIGIETSHEWIVERSGIVERRLARNGETTCSMAADASRHAMAAAGVHPGEIDVIVLSTATPDRLLPSTAVDIQAELGATRAAAFDIGAACAGWLYAMSTAEGLIMSGSAETALEPPERARLDGSTWWGALGVFLWVFFTTFPVAIPFIFMHNAGRALRLSNLVAIVLMFILGYSFGRCAGRNPWVMGISMVVLGAILVGLTMALGG